MNPAAIEQYLREHPTFSWLDTRYVALLTELATSVEFETGHFVYRQDGDANACYIILQGQVAVELSAPGRSPVTIQTLARGDLLGWSWLFPPYTWHFDARALEKTRAIALDARALRERCEEDHDLGYELMKRFATIMVDRLQAARLQLLDVYGAHAG